MAKKTKKVTKVTKPAADTSTRFKHIRHKRQQRREAKQSLAPKSFTGAPTLFKDSVAIGLQYWKLFGGILLVYAVLATILIGGLSGGTNAASLKQKLLQADIDQTTSSIAVFGELIRSMGPGNAQVSSSYQFIIVLLTSLAIIWSVRQIMAAKKVGVRDAFYKGMYPLVPFVLVLCVIALELLPFFLGALIYSTAFSGGLAMNIWEQLVWGAILAGLTAVSLYLLTSTVFALLIVTLPDMQPLTAMRSARNLVRFRRWVLIRKLLFLPVVLFLLAALVTIPLLFWSPAVGQFVFIVFSMSAVVVANIYLYSLYRELL